MAIVASAVPGRRHRMLLGVGLAGVAFIVLWFIRRYVLHYWLEFTEPSFTSYYWPRRAGLLPHSAGGLVAITTGIAQIWLGLTGRAGALHRTLGRLYCAGVLVGCIGGYYMALTIPSKDFAYAGGLFALCTAWALTTTMAVVAIRNRQFSQHREWMLRSYTVTFAFATYRLIYDYWVAPPDNSAWGDQVAALLAWACWSVPLLLLEVVLQLRKVLRPASRVTAGD